MSIQVSENALKVLERRYLTKDDKGNPVETPDQLFRRVARCIAAVDQSYGANKNDVARKEEFFFEMMARLEFLPNSPTLMNAGRPLGQLSACFVLPIEDSMESIFETLKTTAIIHKSGGGTGFSFSRLREKNSRVNATGGIASGPISFLKVFDSATQAVKQGGTRRGANMGILRVDHPDILEFINCKQKDKEISNFNISVSITEKFWKALQKKENYDLVSPYSGDVVGQLNSQEVFDQIIKSAHRNGEPGLIFIDRMNESNPTPGLGSYEATNPCGEQVLLPYESCNLGSINLLRMAKKNSSGYEINWDKLKKTVRAAVHFLDNVIDANKHPVSEIEKMTKLTRKVGLGVMGWASLLARLGIPYNTQQAVDLAESVMSFILTEARIKSLELAKFKGVFPAFEKSVFAQGGESTRFRNATLTTIAPTGTISIIGGPCSSGIEPIFAIAYYRNVMDQTKLVETDNVFLEVARERGFYSLSLLNRIALEGSIQHIDEIPEDVRKVFVTAHDVSFQWHIRMQAAFQKYTDNAVSKTINLSHAATETDVQKAYEFAYELGCKGITVYRDRSREEQVLNVSHQEVKAVAPNASVVNTAAEFIRTRTEPRLRPEITTGTTTKALTGCGNLYVTVNTDETGKPFEIFNQMGKAGGCAASQLEAIGRLVSLALRCGIEKKIVVEQLRGIRCPSPSWDKGQRIFSCADAISRVLEKRLVDESVSSGVTAEPVLSAVGVKEQDASDKPLRSPCASSVKRNNTVGVCPDCGSPLHHEEGCMTCHGCGYSKC